MSGLFDKKLKEIMGLTIDPRTVGRFAAGGVTAGAGATALLNYLNMIKQMNDERVKRKKELDPATSSNTIVLTLPSDKAAAANPDKSMVKHTKTCITMSTGKPHKKQFRRAYDGTFGNKTAGTKTWPTHTASTLAGIAGFAGGSMLVDKLYQKARERQLKNDLEAAKQEYVDLLRGDKTAEAVDDTCIKMAGPEQAIEPTFGLSAYPLSVITLAALLGSGGVAYAAKKFLDERDKTKEKELEQDMPSVNRILFRSAPAKTAEEIADGKEAIDIARASLAVMLDKMEGETRILDTPYVKEAMDRAGTNKHEMLKLADAVTDLYGKLGSEPELRKLFQAAALQNHPKMTKIPGFMQPWMMKLPFFRNLMDREMYRKMAPTFGTPAGELAADDELGFFSRMKDENNPFKTRFSPEGQVYSKIMGDLSTKYSEDKEAVSLGTDLATDIFANIGFPSKATFDTNELAKAIVKAQKTVNNPAAESEREVTIEGADPEAKEYMNDNRARIQAIVKRMLKEQQL